MRQSGRTVDPCAVQSPATVAVATDAPPVAAAADAAAAAITASCCRDRPSSRRLRSWRSPHRSSRRLRQRKRRRRRRHCGRRCDELRALTAHRARLSSPQPTRRCPLHLETADPVRLGSCPARKETAPAALPGATSSSPTLQSGASQRHVPTQTATKISARGWCSRIGIQQDAVRLKINRNNKT
jgi:hypothetical protein